MGRPIRMAWARALALAAAVSVFGLGTGLAAAQEASQESLSGLSRDMQMGIRYYEKGQDTQAMDSLMEVLTKGDPAERSLANEYLNLISRRMNPDQKTPREPVTLRPDRVIAEPMGAGPAAAPAAPQPAAPAAAPAPPPDRALMKTEIRTKIRGMLETGLRQLKERPQIRMLLMQNGDPQAIAIPSPLLFQDGIAFQKDAIKILDALTKVAFGLGEAQVAILPEGTPMGDAKIIDMRRTMGISAHLLAAGVAPVRVSVNLLNSQVDIPRPLMNFRGVIVLFAYDTPMSLSADAMLGDDAGPPLSLGIYPDAIRPDRDEGAVIEFSVQDPPSGLSSWRFQLLAPSVSSERDLAPIQEVVGGSPVFHQIYWNGRRNFFGPPLPAGRYECVLTATDGRNRQRTLHRWIEVLNASGQLPSTLGSGAPPADLAPAPAAPLIKEQARAKPVLTVAHRVAPRRVRVARRSPVRTPARKALAPEASRKSRKARARRKAAAAAKPAGRSLPAKPSAADLVLTFRQGTHQLTPAGENSLARIARWMAASPAQSVTVTGYAQSSENDAAGLAERRAQMVAGLLINKYQIDPKKLTVRSQIDDTASYKVEVALDKGR